MAKKKTEDKNGFQVELGDRTFFLRPPAPSDYKELEARIIERRRSPLDILCAKLDKIPIEHREAMLEKAFAAEPKFADYVSPEERAQYFDTRDGFAFLWWLMIRTNHQDVKLDDIEQLFKDLSDEEFNKVMEKRDEMLAGDEE